MSIKRVWMLLGFAAIGIIAVGMLSQCKPITDKEKTFNGYRIQLADYNPLKNAGAVGRVYKEIFSEGEDYYTSKIGKDVTVYCRFKSYNLDYFYKYEGGPELFQHALYTGSQNVSKVRGRHRFSAKNPNRRRKKPRASRPLDIIQYEVH